MPNQMNDDTSMRNKVKRDLFRKAYANYDLGVDIDICVFELFQLLDMADELDECQSKIIQQDALIQAKVDDIQARRMPFIMKKMNGDLTEEEKIQYQLLNEELEIICPRVTMNDFKALKELMQNQVSLGIEIDELTRLYSED